ncbi:glycoprotein 3-alpha-L-fucosyltransferase A-like, partial [Paramacrobiotus metropolitanus]|uniref:glycoprotein 3-alpha-L-fucosyltransferase A-like n=1 Tax=Paramacrobiotus metropolitanus TaxID=2943436 RepID=UPI002446073C
FPTGFFNLTFTYRLDSDVITDSYFQHFRPSVWKDSREFDEALRNKTGFATTFVSNCQWIPSRRDLYMTELAKYVDVDVYGKCGTKECSTDTPEICDRLVANYKFYLAFENSICKDYVTEKNPSSLKSRRSSVVYGGANYFAIFPKDSFINVMDFENPKALADYLLFLNKNPQEYRKYFQWRVSAATAKLAAGLEARNLSWCRICTILNTRSPKKKVVTDLGRWWNGKVGVWCQG